MSLETELESWAMSTPLPVSLKSTEVKLGVELPSKPALTTAAYSVLLDASGILGKASKHILTRDDLRNRAYLVVYDNPVIITDIKPSISPEASQSGAKPTGFLLCPQAAQGASQSYEGNGAVLTPGAGATITSVANVPAGTYQIQWQVRGSGAVAIGSNYALQVNGVTVLVSNNPVTGQTVQEPVEVTLANPGTIGVIAIAADAGTYNAQFSAIPANAWDVGPNNLELFGQNEMWAIATVGTSRLSVITEREVTQ